MKRIMFAVVVFWGVTSGAAVVPAAAAATPSAAQALRLKPIQEGVDYAQPTPAEAEKCRIEAKRIGGNVGWIVEGPEGLILRRFVDTNGDNVVDQWSYFKDGLEVYRDIDANFNGKADNYRWYNTGGIRWGVDDDEDGSIDQWKQISAEEVTAEAVAALANRDAERYARLVLTPGELRDLGLGTEKAKQLAEQLSGLGPKFKTAVESGALPADTEWIQFSATRPGIVPKGTDGSTEDIAVYENVIAITQTGDSHRQVQIGTLVKVGDNWRLIDVPATPEAGKEGTTAGFFFEGSPSTPAAQGGDGNNDQAQALLGKLEELDEQLDRATTVEAKAQCHAQRADVVEKIAESVGNAADRAMWIRQLADMVSAAVQSGAYPDGADRLAILFKKLEQNEVDEELAAYVKFRQLTAGYGRSVQEPNADFAKIQTQWLTDLKQYIEDYPNTPDTAEAMLQLAIAEEFAAQEDEAKKWYGLIVERFANSPAARKAAGALTRLESVGKQIAFTGTGAAGGQVDLSKYRGRVVLIQYWATWCEPCKADIPAIKEMVAKYGKNFAVIGVSLDNSRQDLMKFLSENRLPWQQIYEDGGLDSRPANQLGILTLPTMILVDQDGKVVSRSIQAAELAGELKKLIR